MPIPSNQHGFKASWQKSENPSPLETARLREAKLIKGLNELAARFGKTFQRPLQINSRGEFSLIVKDGYGPELAAIITKHSPRCGINPGAHIEASACWCYMNHFDVEKMLREQHQESKVDQVVKSLLEGTSLSKQDRDSVEDITNDWMSQNYSGPPTTDEEAGTMAQAFRDIHNESSVWERTSIVPQNYEAALEYACSYIQSSVDDIEGETYRRHAEAQRGMDPGNY